MRSLLVLLCLLGLGGCDVVFDLEGEVVARDAGGEALPGSDAMPDGPAPCPSIETCGQSITHDENGDCTADPCDLCPHLRGVDTDEDGDRIGARCDITEFAASDVRFESFATSFIPAGSWTIFDDTLQAAGPGALRYAVHPVTNSYPYEIRARLNMLGPTATRGIAFNLDNATAPIFQVGVTTINPTDETDRIGPFNV